MWYSLQSHLHFRGDVPGYDVSMSDPISPLLPTYYDIMWSVGTVAILIMLVVALISIGRRSKLLSATQALIWTLLVIFLPLVGPLAWLAVGRRTASALAESHSLT